MIFIVVRKGTSEEGEKSSAHTGQQPQEILHRDFVSTVVDFDVLAVEIERVAAIREHAPREVVARIAGRVVGEHEDDVRVGYAQAFHSSIPALLFRHGHTIWNGYLGECVAHIPNAFAICYPKILGEKMRAVDR